ncbi:MAG: phage protein Gp27 family protein [Candidatus Binatus sp.]|uniref:phage protein Gp27 family protein n=1 Tax=Candidatus Binatus sp. TaxID=2811406 RepID=UPI003C78B684
MSKKQGAKKSEPDGKPKRVPIDPIPFKTWKIKKLPPDLKEQLDKMLTEGTLHSCRQLAKWLGDNGFVISHAAIHKYGQKFERRLEAIRMATEQARIVCEQFKDDDEQMQSALLRLVQTQLFEVLSATNERKKGGAEEGEATVAPVNITALARSVSGLARAETEHRKWAERAREGVAAVEKKVEEARTKGLSKDAADQIKAVLMEI